ncbi:MAG: VanW family protein [Thermoleophilia bacterium]
MRRLLVAVGLTAIVVIAVAAGVLALSTDAPGLVPRGTFVGGVDVGGLSVEAATEKVAEAAAPRVLEPIVIRAGQDLITLSPAAAGLTVDAGGSVAAGLAGPATGSVIQTLWGRLTGRFPARHFPLLLTTDEVRWASATDDVALAVERLAKDARLMLGGGRPKAVAADIGVVLDRGALRVAVARAINAGDSAVDAPVREVVPAVSTEDAQAALEVARTALAKPMTLGYQGARFEVSPVELAAIAEPNPFGIAAGLPITFDTDPARELLGARLSSVEDPPVDAEIVPGDNGRGYSVTPSADGTLVEWPALLGSMARVAVQDGARYVAVPTTTVHPRLTTLDAQDLRERREIASFTTYFSPTSLARVNNIRQVAQILDGYVVRPGETFSFNRAVGPRTRAAGFDEAPVIRDGVLTPGVGGGICQVSTTLFNAVFFAGLPVVERKPHSFYIDHYPVGRDATVSYGATDLRFRNDSDTVILLSISTSPRSVTVSLAAPLWDRTVSYETSAFDDMVEPKSSEASPRKLRDPALPRGAISPLEPGVSGRSVTVARVVRNTNGVLFEDAFSSSYAPKDYVIRVGG